MVDVKTNINMNDIIVKSLKNLDEFYKEVRSLFNTIIVDLRNNYNYGQLKNSPIVPEGSRSLDYPHLWFPYYLTQIFQEKDDKHNYLIVSIVFRKLFGNAYKYEPPLDEIPIIFGRYINCRNKSYLKWFNKDFVFNDDVKIENARKNVSDDLFVIDGIPDYSFDKGYLFKTPLFRCENAHELVETAINELKALEKEVHSKQGGK